MQRYFGSYGLFLLLIPFVMAAAAIVVMAGDQVSYNIAGAVPGGNPLQGPQAITNYGCGTCHVIPGVTGANGRVGPSLAGISQRSFIAGRLPNNPDNLLLWIQHPQMVSPGTDMPELGVTDASARDIAAYLYSLR